MNPKNIILVLIFSMLGLSQTILADSFLKVVNNSSIPIQAIWQAGGCFDVDEDWEGDNQYTVCKESVIKPKDRSMYTFGLFHTDRSVKVFAKGKGRIGYCNSMDHQSITVWDGKEPGTLTVDETC